MTEINIQYAPTNLSYMSDILTALGKMASMARNKYNVHYHSNIGTRSVTFLKFFRNDQSQNIYNFHLIHPEDSEMRAYFLKTELICANIYASRHAEERFDFLLERALLYREEPERIHRSSIDMYFALNSLN